MLPTLSPHRWFLPFSLVAALSTSSAALAADWIHWRGPEQNGVSREKNLPGEFDPSLKEKGNVIWKQPFGGRSAPLVMAGKLYIIQGVGEGIDEGEQVVCFEEKTGKKLWEYRVNVFHTDIVSCRLGWTTLTADPEAGLVYAHTTGGHLLCLDAAGKLVWSATTHRGVRPRERLRRPDRLADLRQRTGDCRHGQRELGRPGARPNRFVAFDGKTGQVVWWSTPTPDALYGTHTSTPVIAVINGQRLFIAGGADGCLHALKVRTGEKVWSYTFGKGFVNGSPIVDGNLVYCNHGESNIEGSPLGRVICVDGSVCRSPDQDAEARLGHLPPPVQGEPQSAARGPLRPRLRSDLRRQALHPRRLRRNPLLPRQGWRVALEIPLRLRGPRLAAHRGWQALHLRRQGPHR